jgi:hypothetical protein
MKLKTYEDWQLLGYHVKKGEKAVAFNPSGKALFSREQTEDTYTFNKRPDKVRDE